MKEDIIKIIFTDITPAMFIVCYGSGVLALTIKYLNNAANRDIHNPRTPFHFSWGFLLSDNVKNIVLNLLILLAAILIFSKIFPDVLTVIGSFIFGLNGIDSFRNKYFPSTKTKQDMNLEYVFTVNKDNDRVISYDGTAGMDKSLADFASAYGYALNGTELTTSAELENGELTELGLISVENVSYIRRPIRRPK